MKQLIDNTKDFSFYIKKINDYFVTVSNAHLKEMGLTLAQMELLLYLAERGDRSATQKDIEQHFHLKHPTVIGILHRMQEKELLEITVNPEDNRSRNILLTADARVVAKTVGEIKNELTMKFTDGMSEEEFANLTSLLKSFYETIYRD